MTDVAVSPRRIIGDRPPAFLSRATLAAELDVSVSTVDEMVRRGVLPVPLHLSTGRVHYLPG